MSTHDENDEWRQRKVLEGFARLRDDLAVLMFRMMQIEGGPADDELAEALIHAALARDEFQRECLPSYSLKDPTPTWWTDAEARLEVRVCEAALLVVTGVDRFGLVGRVLSDKPIVGERILTMALRNVPMGETKANPNERVMRIVKELTRELARRCVAVDEGQ